MKTLAVVGLMLLLAPVALAADLGGTWTGSFVITLPDGKTKNDTALLRLKQNGAEITGTAGPNADQQWPIQNGHVEGDKITFEIANEGHTMTFELAMVDGHLKGEARGEPGSKIPTAALDLAREGEAEKELYRTIASLDAALFDAYNRCDLETFGSYIADDIEFYHDKGGLSDSKQKVVDAVRDNICGKVRREIVPGTLEVYPIAGYGAVETGTHRFYDATAGKDAPPVGIAKFVHIWQYKDGAWKVTRVISYDHQPVTK